MAIQTKAQLNVQWFGIFFLLSSFVGCGGSGAEVLVPVSGVVTFDGEAIEGAVVSFIPTGKNTKAHAGSALTDAEGQFEISNFQRKKGMPAGEYIVTVSCERGPNGEVISSGDHTGPVARREMIPSPWNQITKAGRHNNVNVPDGGKTDFEFKIPKVMSDDQSGPEGMRTRGGLMKVPPRGGPPKPPGK